MTNKKSRFDSCAPISRCSHSSTRDSLLVQSPEALGCLAAFEAPLARDNSYDVGSEKEHGVDVDRGLTYTDGRDRASLLTAETRVENSTTVPDKLSATYFSYRCALFARKATGAKRYALPICLYYSQISTKLSRGPRIKLHP